jgi:hypothetical protein
MPSGYSLLKKTEFVKKNQGISETMASSNWNRDSGFLLAEVFFTPAHQSFKRSIPPVPFRRGDEHLAELKNCPCPRD